MTAEANERAKARTGAAVAPRAISWDIAVQLVGRFANLALGIVVTALLARTLGGAGFGVWSTLIAVGSLLGVIGNMGLEQVALRCAAAEPERESQWLGALLVIRQLLSLLALALCIGTVVLIAPNREALIAGIVMMLSLLTAAASSLRVAFQLRVRNSYTIAVMTIQSVLWGAVVIWGYATGVGIVALAIGFAVTTSFASLLQGALALRLTRVRFGEFRRHSAELIRVGIPIAVGGVFVIGYGQIDQVLVFKIAGSEEAGLYGAAYRLFSQSSFVPVSVSTTVFALLAASFVADGERFRVLLQTSLELLLAVAIGALALTAVYSGEIVGLVFGREFDRAAAALPVLMGAFVLVSVGYLQDLLVIISRQQNRFVVAALLALTLNVGLNVALIPRYGFMAAAWVTVGTELFVVAARWLIVRSKLPARPTFGRIPRLVGAGSLLLGLLLLGRELGLPLAVALVLSLLAYPSLLFAAGAINTADVRLIFGKRELAENE
jgi:O-antigen/teichoic acid export membrane protein